MGQLQSCLSGQQAADVDCSNNAKQHTKASPTAAAPATPAASSATKQQLTQALSPAASHLTEQQQDKQAKKLAGTTAAAGADEALAGTAAATGPGKFDPHQTQPGQLGAPLLPGAAHNPHVNGPPRPPCEDERLEVAEQISELLDAAPKKELENILSLVCSIFGVNNALIALFGDRRIYIINTVGGFKAGDFPWRWSFCGWTMASEQHSVMVINDALQDARFHDNKYVQEIGVRFYCGAPLVSSSGHRLGTLCFADSEPRVFDTSSLQILVNFAELVTRELEKDIALAKQQLAQAGNGKAERAQQYKLMLRTLDCVTSAVLLVDTSKPDWPIVHANSGWQRLLDQCGSFSSAPFSSSYGSSNRGGGAPGSSSVSSVGSSSRHEGEWQSSHTAGVAAAAAAAAVAGTGGGGSSSDRGKDKLEGFCCGVLPGMLKPIGEDSSNHTSADKNGSVTGNSSSSSTDFLIGRSLWSLVDGQVLAQLGSHKSSSNSETTGASSSSIDSATASSSSSSSSSSSLIGVGSSGWCPGDQIVEQVRGRQSFTLRGVKLAAGFGGASAQLSFRCAGFSTLEGAVSVCLPAFAPDATDLAAAGAEVAAKSPVPVKVQHAAAGETLYFVTVKLHAAPRSNASSTSCSSNASSMWTSATNVQQYSAAALSSSPNGGVNGGINPASGHRLSLSTCLYPQFDSGGLEDVAASEGFSDHSLGLSGPARSQNLGGLVVISSVGPDGTAAAAAAAEARAGSSSSSRQGSLDLPCSSSDCSSNQNVCQLVTQGSSSSSSLESLGGGMSSVCAGLVCKRIAGLALGGQIAAGSYGRVYRGDYFGSKVAVKVLDGHAVLRRDETTGFCLEALLSEQLKHPNIMRTLAWAVVTGEGKLPARQQIWGETLDPDKPSVDTIAAAVANANGKGGIAAAAAAGTGNGSSNSVTNARGDGSNPYDKLMRIGTPATPAAGSGVSNSVSDMAAQNIVDTWEDEEGARDEDVTAGQTWMVLEYCDKGCLQDAVERGWLRESRSCVSGPVKLLAVLATAAEIASGMALLHGNGIIHGDLSAFNVMLSSADAAASIGDRGFVAKVADFGLSRMLTHGSKVVTKTYGTITHMPPETLEHGVAGKAADVYSFGVLLWQMVTGSRAWAGMSHMGVVNAVCCEKKQLQFPPDAPEALTMLGRACMAYNAAERPTFEDVLEILEPLNDVIMGRASGAGSGGGTGCSSSANVVAAAAAAVQGGAFVDVESF